MKLYYKTILPLLTISHEHPWKLDNFVVASYFLEIRLLRYLAELIESLQRIRQLGNLSEFRLPVKNPISVELLEEGTLVIASGSTTYKIGHMDNTGTA